MFGLIEYLDQNKSKKIYFAFYLVVLVIYIWVRIANLSTIETFRTYPDTARYIAIANSPLNSEGFWAAEAPVVVPAIYRLLQGNYELISWFQTILSIFSWITLALVVSQRMEKAYFRLIAFLILLAFSLSHAIVLWDWVILSESISGSLMALIIAYWFRLSTSNPIRWGQVIMVTILGVIWMFTRDSNALIVLMMAVFPVLFVIFRKSDKRLLVVSLVYIISYWFSGLTAEVSGRWVGPNLNVVSRRILPDKRAFEFYVSNGMPDSDLLPAYIDQNAGPADEGFRDGETNELDLFHQWHRENGKSIFVKFLLSTPVKTIAAPLDNAYALMDIRPLRYYGPQGFAPILPEEVENFFFFRSFSTAIAIASTFLIALGIVIAIGLSDPKWITPIILALLIYPHGFLIWHASGGDVIRHAYQFRVHYRLTFWFFILFSMNTVLIPQAFRIIYQRWLWILYQQKVFLALTGTLLILISFLVDFIAPGKTEFSIGYTQGAGIVIGFLLLAAGILITIFNPERVDLNKKAE